MTTISTKPSEIDRKWYLFDAQDLILGRLSAEIASILQGKNNPKFSPNIDCGDNVIVINAEKVHLTGRKLFNLYQWHTGYPGGLKSKTIGDERDGNYPERVILKSVERMLKKSPLGRQQIRKLHVYKGSEHPHKAQKPVFIDFGQQNRKNKKGNE